MNWTDHPLKAGYPNRAVYIQELRKALDEKREEIGLSPADWSEPINIKEPKKFLHTKQLMLACNDTAKKLGYDSYQDILKRKWTPIQQGGPYRYQIVNDLRQVIDGLPIFFEDFPGTELDLDKWEIIRNNHNYFIDNAFRIDTPFSRHLTTSIKTINYRTPPDMFRVEWDARINTTPTQGTIVAYFQVGEWAANLQHTFLPSIPLEYWVVTLLYIEGNHADEMYYWGGPTPRRKCPKYVVIFGGQNPADSGLHTFRLDFKTDSIVFSFDGSPVITTTKTECSYACPTYWRNRPLYAAYWTDYSGYVNALIDNIIVRKIKE